jgi:hypothetical protein
VSWPIRGLSLRASSGGFRFNAPLLCARHGCDFNERCNIFIVPKSGTGRNYFRVVPLPGFELECAHTEAIPGASFTTANGSLSSYTLLGLTAGT